MLAQITILNKLVNENYNKFPPDDYKHLLYNDVRNQELKFNRKINNLQTQFDQLRTKKDLLDKPQYGNEKQIDKNICDQQERYDIIKQIKIYDDHQIDFPNILSHIKHTKVIDFFFENICKVNLKLDNKNKISKAYSKIFNDSSTLSLDHSKREEFWENLKNNSSS